MIEPKRYIELAAKYTALGAALDGICFGLTRCGSNQSPTDVLSTSVATLTPPPPPTVDILKFPNGTFSVDLIQPGLVGLIPESDDPRLQNVPAGRVILITQKNLTQKYGLSSFDSAFGDPRNPIGSWEFVKQVRDKNKNLTGEEWHVLADNEDVTIDQKGVQHIKPEAVVVVWQGRPEDVPGKTFTDILASGFSKSSLSVETRLTSENLHFGWRMMTVKFEYGRRELGFPTLGPFKTRMSALVSLSDVGNGKKVQIVSDQMKQVDAYMQEEAKVLPTIQAQTPTTVQPTQTFTSSPKVESTPQTKTSIPKPISTHPATPQVIQAVKPVSTKEAPITIELTPPTPQNKIPEVVQVSDYILPGVTFFAISVMAIAALKKLSTLFKNWSQDRLTPENDERLAAKEREKIKAGFDVIRLLNFLNSHSKGAEQNTALLREIAREAQTGPDSHLAAFTDAFARTAADASARAARSLDPEVVEKADRTVAGLRDDVFEVRNFRRRRNKST